jgi:hypothetical protein
MEPSALPAWSGLASDAAELNAIVRDAVKIVERQEKMR